MGFQENESFYRASNVDAQEQKSMENSNAGITPGVFFTILILLLILSLTLPLIRLGKPELGSPHEARIVVTGRNMAESGDWVVPHFNGALRLQKPPLPYWTIAALTKVFGPLDETLFRLPSAVMGIAGVLLTLFIGRTIFSWRIGIIAALIQALTIKYVIESRLARVDIYLTFWVLICLLLLSLVFFGSKRRDWLWPIVWAVIAMGFLSKWIAIFLFVMPPMLYGLWICPDRRARLRWHLLGLGVFSLLALSWVVLLVNRLGWETVQTGWAREVSDNITSPVHRANHGVFHYIPQLFVLVFPWSALIPVALTIPFWPQCKAEKQKLLWLAYVAFVAIVVLSLVSKKKADYLLPIVPVISILGAKAWKAMTDEIATYRKEKDKKWRRGLGVIQSLIFVVIGIGGLFYCFFDTELRRYGAIIVCSLSIATSGIIAARFIYKGKGWHAISSLFVGSIVFIFVLFGWFLPLETRISSADFARSISETVGAVPVIYYRGRDDTLVYHLHRTIPSVDSVHELSAIVDKNPETFVLVQGRYLGEVQQVAGHVVLHHPRFRDVSFPLPGRQNEALDVYLISRSDIGVPRREFASMAPKPPAWLNVKNLWLAFGFIAQGLFFGRFLLQWIASERKKESVIPIGFWWLSLTGGIMLFSYAVHRKDPVFVVGQGMGVLIYLRNLYFIYFRRSKRVLQNGKSESV